MGGVVAFDLLIKTLAVGYNGRGRFYHIGGFKGVRWYNQQLDTLRSRRDRCKKKSRRYLHLSRIYQRVSERKRNKRTDCLHKASHLITHKLVESTVVVGDLSGAADGHQGAHRASEGTASGGGQRLGSLRLCADVSVQVRPSWEDARVRRWRESSKRCSRCGQLQPMPLWKRTYRCQNCGLVMDRDENSAVNHYQRFFARLPSTHG